MSLTPLYKPSLYEQDTEGRPRLLGGRCECGYVFFPMQTFGCERCGRMGAALQPYPLCGAGTLIASAVVHMHGDKRRPTPFVIGTIALDDGPIVRTLLIGSPLAGSSHTRVTATLVPVHHGEPPTCSLDLRFVLDESGMRHD